MLSCSELQSTNNVMQYLGLMYTPKTLLLAATIELFLMVQVYQGDQFTFVQSWLVGLGTIYTKSPNVTQRAQ